VSKGADATPSKLEGWASLQFHKKRKDDSLFKDWYSLADEVGGELSQVRANLETGVRGRDYSL